MWLALIIIVALFLLTVLFGAPYVPTKNQDVDLALDLLKLKRGQTLLELGSGDGRLLKAAAQRGWRAVGYEINPIMWLISKLRLWPHRHLARVELANYKTATWPKSVEGLYIFGSERELKFVAKRLESLKSPLTLVSYGFMLPGQEAAKADGPFYRYKIK